MQDQENVKEIAESEEPEEEVTEEATQGPAPETAEAKPQKPIDEMKVVIILKADNVMLGVQSPDCDPVYTTMKGDLAAALQQVPAFVTEAKQKWTANPRYPKANLPEPAPGPTPTRTPVAPKSEKKTNQPSFF